MKVILDANVLISYLLAPDDIRTVVQAVEACFTEQITLFVSPELIDELKTTLRDSASLSSRIAQIELDNLLDALTLAGTVLPPLTIPSAGQRAYSRDIDDDYLIAQALLHDVDTIVSGDKDLLDLVAVQSVQILSPAQFWAHIGDPLKHTTPILTREDVLGRGTVIY
jgi:putative PIN family toxin of toxin-antitoxin system